jgi:hypothetical protein
MITQAIKQWLGKMFAWWPWRRWPKTDYLHTSGSLNKGAAQEMTARSTIDGVAPRRTEASPRPYIEEWPERVVQPSADAINRVPTEERTETTFPATPIEKAREASTSSISPTPRAERQLEFLRYLVKRGIVNEGFAEGTAPDQYKFDDNRQAGSNQS